MAHSACHAGGLFHPHPLSRLPAHGAVSEYEPLNIPDKLHTKFIPIEECTEDVIPLMAVPVPAKKATRNIIPDPKLTVTPNKLERHANSKFVPEPSLAITPDKLGRGDILIIPRPDPSLCATPEQTLTSVSRINPNCARSKKTTLPVIDPDPLLTVTPERATHVAYTTKSNLRSENSGAELVSNSTKVKQKVRFDIRLSGGGGKCVDTSVLDNLDCGSEKTVGSKAYQPGLYTGSDNGVDGGEDFFSDEQPRAIQYTVTRHSDNLAHSTQAPNTDVADPETKSTSNKRERTYYKTRNTNKQKEVSRSVDPIGSLNKLVEVPDVVLSCPNKNPKRKVVITRELQHRPVSNEYQYPFHADAGEQEMEHVFSRPEYNNTLKVYSEMKEIGGMVPDVDTALRKHLGESDERRVDIDEKAASKVNQNFCASQYSGLVGLEAPIADLCHKTEREMTLKAKITKSRTRKTPHRQEPDLMQFFSADLQKEAPDFQLFGAAVQNEALSTAPQDLAFDLYRHNRVWEGLP